MPAAALYTRYIDNYRRNIEDVNNGYRGPQQHLAVNVNPNPDHRTGVQQQELDAAMWYGACTTGSAQEQVWIRKIFHLFKYAGVMVFGAAGWADWSLQNFPIACLMAHGGRINVQTPGFRVQGAYVDPVWNWLNGGNPIPARGYATHGMNTRNAQPLIQGHMQHFTESHGALTSVWGHMKNRHFAFNPALGGLGQINPTSRATQVAANQYQYVPVAQGGVDGHIYVYYRPPYRRHLFGGMLIGCENAQHGAGVNPHTAAGHGLGGRQAISATGGRKWDDWNAGGAAAPARNYTGFICDLVPHGDTQPNINAYLVANPLFDPDDLDQPPNAVPNVVGWPRV
jgi:hypothetical protein